MYKRYGEYAELSGILHKYIKLKDKTLVIGCGSSRLSEDLYDLGYRNLVNIDISDVVIKQMKTRNEANRPDLIYEQMDVFKMLYDDGQYSVVLDKGTLDALLPDDSESSTQQIVGMFEEIDRVLKLGGRYVCISLAQKHVVDNALQFFVERGWMTRIHCLPKDKSANEADFPLPVFTFIFTKFKKIPGASPILEFTMGEDGKVGRYNSAAELTQIIEETQNYNLLKRNIHKRLQSDEQIQLDLQPPGSMSPRFTLTVVDRARIKQRENKFAIFIVPQGREVEWLFSSNAGRIQLSETAGFKRLVVVCLHRGQSYGSLKDIQDELSEKVLELAPSDLESNVKVPFLSAGEDIGERKVRYEGESEINGKFLVEEVKPGDGAIYRRLIFLSEENLVQSEVKLKQTSHRAAAGGKKGKKKKKPVRSSDNGELIIDESSLSIDYHAGFVLALAMVEDILTKIDDDLRILLIGLGGGTLPTCLHKHFKKVRIDVVELDSAMLKVATEWFGLKTDERLKVYTDDGIRFIEEKAASQASEEDKYDMIMFDVDNKEKSAGRSCPPEAFVKPEFLVKVKSILQSTGFLALNLACHNQEMKGQILANIQDCFGVVASLKSDENVNQHVYATRKRTDEEKGKQPWKSNWRNNAVDLSKIAAKNNKQQGTSDLDLSEYMKDLQII
ncbi:putative methyltransferase-like protein 13-like [Apostichopus japonicus]|uniref:Putative methyltransferase-like protein 13-like n=1 Tax=Stichopus japonicus TaxID=307972 RepID=A0A2G8LG00_STIJA|nr:putative methyltransferase-like protein 13-like [Apostichopus japonicus]